MLFCIIGVFVVVASDTTQTYHVAIVGFLSSGLVMTTSSVNILIYSPEGAKEAAAAGHILLSMVAVSAFLLMAANRNANSSSTDCLDILFRLNPVCSIPRLLGLICTAQGPQTFPQWSRNVEQLWQSASRYLNLPPESSPNVFLAE